jgi:arginine exporter protein ArgO
MLDLALLFLLSIFVSAGVAFSGLAVAATPFFAALPYVFGIAFLGACAVMAHEAWKRHHDEHAHSDVRTA